MFHIARVLAAELRLSQKENTYISSAEVYMSILETNQDDDPGETRSIACGLLVLVVTIR